jgi:cardiolipin synthase A/B
MSAGWPVVVSHLLSVLGFGMALLLAGGVLRDRRAPGTTLAWLLAIVLVPYLGVPLYLVFGGRKVKRMASKKGRLYDAIGRQLTSANDPRAAARPEATEMERMLCSSGAPPMREGNRVALLVTGEDAYASILEAIDAATRRIEIATLILAGDEVGGAVVSHLTAKAKAGVEVRVLIDALFAFQSSRAMLAGLLQAGGKVAWFMPLFHVPFRGHANLRLHRKMVIVDDRVAVVGGMNLAREYMGPTPLAGRWVDLSMRIEGPAVDDLAEVFRSDWAFASGEQLGAPPDGGAERAGPERASGEALQVVASGPDAPGDRIYDALLTGIFQATRRLYIATPYFIPDDALDRALTLAVRRGVDVRVLVPARSNHRLADWAGASHLRLLVEAGAKVQLYLPGMLHAKVVILDDDLALVGSANMDMRSLFLDYEVALACTAPARVAELAAWFEGASRDTGTLAPAGAAREVLESVARLVGPLV